MYHSGLGFGVWDLGFRAGIVWVQGSEFMVQGLGFRVYVSGFRV